MTIDCDHPRPKLELPGYTPPRLAWQPPAFIPGLPPDASRVIREALQGIYDELMRQGARRNTVPLMEDLALVPGQIVQGVGNGETLTLLPPGVGQAADPVTVVLTDVVLPVTVVDPDGTSHSLTSPGVYEFLPDGNESYLGSVFSDLLSAVPTDTLLGRDTAGAGVLEYITLVAPLEFSGSLTVRIGTNGISNALFRQSGPLSVVGRSANSTGNVADISAVAASDAVFRESGGVLGFGQVATAGIANDAVTNAKLANMATPRLKGRTTAATGDPEDLTLTNSTSITWNTGTGGAIATERAALTGAIAASANTNTTQFSGIRDNGSLETARGFINVLSTGTITALVTQDAGNDEHEWTWAVNQGANYTWTGSHSFGNVALAAAVFTTTLGVGTTSNLAIGAVNTVRIAGSGGGSTSSLTGMVPTSDGQLVFLEHTTNADTLILIHDATSTAANRFYCPGETDLTIATRAGVWLRYDGTLSRWMVAIQRPAGITFAVGASAYTGTVNVEFIEGPGTILTDVVVAGPQLELTYEVDFATQAEQRTASSLITSVAPGTQNYHPSAGKFWVLATGGTAAIVDSYNVSSTTDAAVGWLTVTTNNDFTSASWCSLVSIEGNDASPDAANDAISAYIVPTSKAAGSVQVFAYETVTPWNFTDPASWNVAGFGDF